MGRGRHALGLGLLLLAVVAVVCGCAPRDPWAPYTTDKTREKASKQFVDYLDKLHLEQSKFNSDKNSRLTVVRVSAGYWEITRWAPKSASERVVADEVWRQIKLDCRWQHTPTDGLQSKIQIKSDEDLIRVSYKAPHGTRRIFESGTVQYFDDWIKNEPPSIKSSLIIAIPDGLSTRIEGLTHIGKYDGSMLYTPQPGRSGSKQVLVTNRVDLSTIFQGLNYLHPGFWILVVIPLYALLFKPFGIYVETARSVYCWTAYSLAIIAAVVFLVQSFNPSKDPISPQALEWLRTWFSPYALERFSRFDSFFYGFIAAFFGELLVFAPRKLSNLGLQSIINQLHRTRYLLSLVYIMCLVFTFSGETIPFLHVSVLLVSALLFGYFAFRVIDESSGDLEVASIKCQSFFQGPRIEFRLFDNKRDWNSDEFRLDTSEIYLRKARLDKLTKPEVEFEVARHYARNDLAQIHRFAYWCIDHLMLLMLSMSVMIYCIEPYLPSSIHSYSYIAWLPLVPFIFVIGRQTKQIDARALDCTKDLDSALSYLGKVGSNDRVKDLKEYAKQSEIATSDPALSN